MSVSAIAPSTAASAQAAEAAAPKSKTLGQEEFFQILVAQLTTQDPLNPLSDAEFIGQMAQFSQLESSRGMMAELQSIRTQQDFVQANSLIGRQVQFETSDATGYLGTVTSIEVKNGQPLLAVGDQTFTLDQVVRVHPAALSRSNAN